MCKRYLGSCGFSNRLFEGVEDPDRCRVVFHNLNLFGFDGKILINVFGVDHRRRGSSGGPRIFRQYDCEGELFLISLSSFIYLNYPLNEAIRRISKIGYDGVDIWGGRPHAYRKDHDWAESAVKKELMGSLNFGAASFIPAQFRYPTCLCSNNEVIRLDSVEYIKDGIQNAASLGAPTVSICPGHSLFGQSTTAAWDCLCSSLDEICSFASSYSIRIAIEPADRYETDLINTIPDALRMIDQLGYANLGVVLDTGHSHVVGESAVEAVAMAQDRLFHVHIDDNHGLRDQHLIPGQGTFDFVPFLESLEKWNYPGYLGVELSWDVTLEPDQAALKALEYLRKLI